MWLKWFWESRLTLKFLGKSNKNFDNCIDDYEGMIIKNTKDNLISDSFLFEISECDPLNLEGITCASQDEIKIKT